MRLQLIVYRLMEEALKSDMNYRHASAVMYGNKILSIGFNHHRGCCDGKPIMSMHAEMHAIHRIRLRLLGPSNA